MGVGDLPEVWGERDMKTETRASGKSGSEGPRSKVGLRSATGKFLESAAGCF